MRPLTWNERFLTSTRGRIIELLRQRSYTVNELAAALGLTDNTVRAHLATLERDGYVQQTGVRPGVRRPHHEFGITVAAERLFLEACEPVLDGLLTALEKRLAAEPLDEIVHQAGQAMASEYTSALAGMSPAERWREAAAAFARLGTLVSTGAGADVAWMEASRCPVAEMVSHHTEVCSLMEAFLSGLVGQPVRNRCNRGVEPKCRFETPAQKVAGP